MLQILLLVLASITVQVDGPVEAKVEEVITLKFTSAEAVNNKWLVPSGVKTMAVGQKLIVVPLEPGKFSITCICVDKKFEIAADVHTIEVK